jgi:hypothetical protein
MRRAIGLVVLLCMAGCSPRTQEPIVTMEPQVVPQKQNDDWMKHLQPEPKCKDGKCGRKWI